MKKSVISALILSTLTSYLSADVYIKVATMPKNNSEVISQNLKSNGFSTIKTNYKNLYRIFAGPFKNEYEARKALQIIKKNVVDDAYITKNQTYLDDINKLAKKTEPKIVKKVAKKVKPKIVNKPQTKQVVKKSLKKEDVTIAKVEQIKETPKVIQPPVYKPTPKQEQYIQPHNYTNKEIKKEKDFFVGASIGSSKFKHDSIYDLKDSSTTYATEAGYNLSDDIFITANYQHTPLDKVKFDNYYTTLNYKFYSDNDISSYIGGLVGYSKQKWETNPLPSVSSISDDSVTMGGFQLGGDIAVSDDFSMFMIYRYIDLGFTSHIISSTDTKDIDYDNEQNVNIGLKYNF